MIGHKQKPGNGVAINRTVFAMVAWITLGGPLSLAAAQGAQAAEDTHKDDHETQAPLRLDALRAQGVVTGKAVRQRMGETLQAPAEIGFNEARRVAVSARSGGWAEKVVVFANQRVGQHQLLAEIYSPEFLSAQQEYLLIAARAQRTAGDDNQSETRGLLADAEQRLRLLGLTSEEIRQLATTREPFPYLHVHSPVAGTVIEHKLNTGDTVQPGQELYIVADLRTVWANIALTETQIAKVKAGQAVSLTVKAYPDMRFAGRILSLGAGMDEATRTVRARALITNTGNRLKPGMFADAEIRVQAGAPVLAVPAEAVVRLEGRDTVFKVEGDALHPQAVEVGATRGGLTEVRTGLADGEEIAVKGTFLLKSLLLKSQMGEGHGH